MSSILQLVSRRGIAQVREGLGLLSEASAHAARDAQPEGLVRLSCGVSFGRRFVLPILPYFFAQYPQMRVELCLSDARVDLVRDGFDLGIHGYLMRDGFDLGIRSAVAPPGGMVVRKVSTIHTVLVASPLICASLAFLSAGAIWNGTRLSKSDPNQAWFGRGCSGKVDDYSHWRRLAP